MRTYVCCTPDPQDPSETVEGNCESGSFWFVHNDGSTPRNYLECRWRNYSFRHHESEKRLHKGIHIRLITVTPIITTELFIYFTTPTDSHSLSGDKFIPGSSVCSGFASFLATLLESIGLSGSVEREYRPHKFDPHVVIRDKNPKPWHFLRQSESHQNYLNPTKNYFPPLKIPVFWTLENPPTNTNILGTSKSKSQEYLCLWELRICVHGGSTSRYCSEWRWRNYL